jgi:L-cysteine S-thiosulfotransferase
MDRRRRHDLSADRSYSRRLSGTVAAIGAVAGVVAVVAAARAGLPDNWVPRSGLTFMTPGIKAMQADDFGNPGMLWVNQGQELWTRVEGAAGKSCASCHGDLSSMKGLQYPQRQPDGRLINLELRIERCRTEHMQAPPLGYESDALLALTTAVRYQSRRLPVSIPNDEAALAAGETYFRQRRGRLNLACADCHEHSVGKKIRDETITQGQTNGFPTYRVRWETLGSVHRRFQACNESVGAQPEPLGSQTYIALEWFLAWRGRGLAVETPAVRQ